MTRTQDASLRSERHDHALAMIHQLARYEASYRLWAELSGWRIGRKSRRSWWYGYRETPQPVTRPAR